MKKLQLQTCIPHYADCRFKLFVDKNRDILPIMAKISLLRRIRKLKAGQLSAWACLRQQFFQKILDTLDCDAIPVSKFCLCETNNIIKIQIAGIIMDEKQILKDFDRDGFVLIKNVFSSDEIEKIRKTCKKFTPGFGTDFTD